MRWVKKHEVSMKGIGPGKRWGHTCNAIRGGKLLYVFGGYAQHNSQTNQVLVFDTASQTWSEPSMKGIPPIPRDNHTCTTVGDSLFVFGGTDGMIPLKDLHVLDTSSNTWTSPRVVGDIPEAREGHGAALVGKRLFIFGGCGKSLNNSYEVYYNDLYILDTGTFVWQRASTFGTLPAARDSHSCSSCRNIIVVIGGQDEHGDCLADIHILDTDTLVWQKLPTSGKLLPPRAGHSTVAFGKYIFVFGGFADAHNLHDDLYVLDLDTCIWSEVLPGGDRPSARFAMSGDCLDPSKHGILVFIGGCNKKLDALDDIYYLYTGYIRDDGKEVPRLENISLRKQLKMKCQEQHFQQRKRAFQATVTKNSANAFTIEAVIDGKPMRGILFSTSSSTNPNPRDREVANRPSVKDVGHSEAGPSMQVVPSEPRNLTGLNSTSEIGKTDGALTAENQTTLENPPETSQPTNREIGKTDGALTAENQTTLENPPETSQPTNQDDHTTLGNPPETSQPTNQDNQTTLENPPETSQPTNQDNQTTLDNPPEASQPKNQDDQAGGWKRT